MHDALHLDDWGGTGPVLHLAHANGFPPGSYRKLIDFLKPRYRVVTIRSRALVPGSDPRALRNWHDLADELVHALRSRGLRDVIGVGHSVGGVASLLASVKAPELFRAVVALDPVLLTGKRLWMLQAASLLGMRSRMPLARGARRRRERWSSREEVAASYRKKALFHRLDPEAFQDYLTHGLVELPGGGVRLAIPAEWEARVFETIPHDVWPRLRSVKVPSLVVRGDHTDTLTPEALARVRRTVPGVRTEALPGTHLFPLEQPEACARSVLSFLDSLDADRGPGLVRPA
ncbi:alpha/beta fold hydrolase [Myxococcus sp. RHSTA-1-4]|uniref:alpha/beta fold hydrolase n=1 Tax=Myxococcus sp. RHSTA-1-4 TaxID=2874601 RepID=UPI001CBE9DCB|nr:alpha/beta hydrolase [Myxococcus sp. RHSTA-1-4]MBZ4417795.1 alpha/beta hydrolase [Myxococcus sp. RHSTA-1-4]